MLGFVCPKTRIITLYILKWILPIESLCPVCIVGEKEEALFNVFNVALVELAGHVPIKGKLDSTCINPSMLFYILAIWKNPFKSPPDKTKKMSCAPSEDRWAWASAQSDQFLLSTQWVAKDPKFLQRTAKTLIRLDDLSLRWSHTSFWWFCHAAAHLSLQRCLVCFNYFHFY